MKIFHPGENFSPGGKFFTRGKNELSEQSLRRHFYSPAYLKKTNLYSSASLFSIQASNEVVALLQSFRFALGCLRKISQGQINGPMINEYCLN